MHCVRQWASFGPAFALEALEQSRELGDILAAVACNIAFKQLKVGRCVLIGNVACGDLFYFDPEEQFWEIGRVVEANVRQYALGLLRHVEPIYKNIAIWARIRFLPASFGGVRCTCRSHCMLAGSENTTLAQAWPVQMCIAIVNDVLALLRQSAGSNTCQPAGVPFAYAKAANVCGIRDLDA